MKSRLKFKKLFSIIALSFIAFLPLVDNSLNVKANTTLTPIFELEEGFFSYNNKWFLLIKIEDSEFRYSVNNSITVYNSNKGVYGTYQVNSVINWWLTNYGETDNEFLKLDYLNLASIGLPNLEHYSEYYYLIDMRKWGVQTLGFYINNEIIKISIRTDDTNVLIWDKTFNSSKHNFQYLSELLNEYQGTNLFIQGYNKGVTDGKNEAFNNYDRLLPNVLGSTLMFFTSIFGSINFFGISLLSIIGIIGGILLLLMVLKLIRGG
ncbi:MAG: hypothetical protein QXI16_06270 [Sulfolobaceae archaeon]